MLPVTRVEHPMKELARLGQSIWLDYIRRSLITSGELKRLVEQEGSAASRRTRRFSKRPSPAAPITPTARRAAKATRIWMRPPSMSGSLRDIQDAADVLRPVYDRTNGRDGYVSLEVSPFLANETEATIEKRAGCGGR